MNDLTKEELIAIHETYSWICEEFSQPDSDYAIKDKLQALIDNYCEHEVIHSPSHPKCEKCGRLIW